MKLLNVIPMLLASVPLLLSGKTLLSPENAANIEVGYPGKVTLELKELPYRGGSLPAAVFTAEALKTGKAATYAGLKIKFAKPLDLSNMTALEIPAECSRPVPVMVTLFCHNGLYTSPYTKRNIAAAMEKIVFERKTFTAQGKPDLSRVYSVTIGFGLWKFNTLQSGFRAGVGEPFFVTPDSRFLIPRPTAPVALDGEYRKDWGHENNLYVWTPPPFFRLDGKKDIAARADLWKGPARLSGRFSFMYDDQNLYLLADTADATVQTGGAGAAYSNDSIELFLYPGLSGRSVRNGGALYPGGVQLVFDCGPGNGVCRKYTNGKKETIAVRSRLKRITRLVDGKQTSGYVLEAAIPWTLFPKFKPERGARIGYTLKLNDSSGISFSTNPENPKAYMNTRGYRIAYLEYPSEERTVNFRLGPVADDPGWPERFRTDGGLWEKKFQAVRRPSSLIDRFYLNGFWAGQSVRDDHSSPEKTKWSYLLLPFGFSEQSSIYSPGNDGKLSKDELPFSRFANGNTTFFWFERTVEIPKEWKGSHIRFVCEYLIGEALVLVNGKSAGAVNTVDQSVDITPFLKFGEVNRLDLRLFTSCIRRGEGPDNGASGITGDLYLEKTPDRLPVKEIRVRNASGLDGSLDVELVFSAPGTGTATALLLNADGKTEKKVSVTVNGSSKAELKTKFDAFRPWSPEHPYLYTLRVRFADASGKTLDERNLSIGFRTFETKNARFHLNGKPIRLRTGFAALDYGVIEPGRMELLKEFGFNSIYLSTFQSRWNEPLFDLLDRTGFLVMAPMDRSANPAETAAAVKRARNHPSVIGYISDAFGQLDINGFIHNPFCTDDRYLPDSPSAKERYSQLQKRRELFHTLDPFRQYVPQATGNWAGFMRNTHQYPCNDLNLIDRLRWQEPWSKRDNPELPLWIYEAGTFNLPWYDACDPDHLMTDPIGRRRERFLMQECAARYFGDRCFENWRIWDRLLLRTALRNFRINGVDGFTGWVVDQEDIFLASRPQEPRDNRRFDVKYMISPWREVMTDHWMRSSRANYLQALKRGVVLRQWPEHYGMGTVERKNSIFTDVYLHEMQPFFACITGAAPDPFSLDRNYFAGDSLRKQIYLVNDGKRTAEFSGTVTLLLDGRKTAVQSFSGKAEPGERLFLPFEFKLPEIENGKRTSASLELRFADPFNGRSRLDRFELAVFGDSRTPAPPPSIPRMGIAGTPQLTRRAGITGRRVDLRKPDFSGLDRLIVESGALTRDIDGAALKKFAANGGQVLILPQKPEGLLSHELQERWLEIAFPTEKSHPLLDGLHEEDFRYWNGKADSLPDRKAPSKFFRNGQSAAMDTPHLSNRNLIAGYTLAKPHLGSFRSILSGGFGLGESILLEVSEGRGRYLFCQADLAGRYGADPAATRLARNLFRWLKDGKPADPVPGVRYSGDEQGKKFLDQLGISIGENSPVAVVGKGGTAPSDASVRDIVWLGDADRLPQDVAAKQIVPKLMASPAFIEYHPSYSQTMPWPGTDYPDGAPAVFAGITAMDLYLFENPSLTAYKFKDGKNVWRSRLGTLAVRERNGTRSIFCGYRADTGKSAVCRRKVARLYSGLFHNLGVASRFTPSFSVPEYDLSDRTMTFAADTDGKGESTGFPDGRFGRAETLPIRAGTVWEEQGAVFANPHMAAVPDSAYDGFGWYYLEFDLSAIPSGRTAHLHLGRVRDISTFDLRANETSLWVNGKKMPAPKAWNAHRGGRGARLFTLPAGALRKGRNRIAIRIFNSIGPGGIDRKPVKLEFDGINGTRLLPELFHESKYTNYFFWCW